MSEINKYVGNQIRYFRKLRAYSLRDLAEALGRSVSAVSKYESGSISIDINTLEHISDVLEIRIEQLLPPLRTKSGAGQKDLKAGLAANHFFLQQDIYYMYFSFNSNIRDENYGITVSVIEIDRQDEGDDRIVLYSDCPEPYGNYRNCTYVYHGTVLYYDFVVYFMLENMYHAGDYDYICAKVPFKHTRSTAGLYTGVSESMRNPAATKVIISAIPLDLTEELAAELAISDSESLRDIKRRNSLIIK